jgi:hypothetical protein
MIRSVSLLPFNSGLPYLVHTLIMVDTSIPGVSCNLNLIFMIYQLLNLCQDIMIRPVSPLPYSIHTFMMEGTDVHVHYFIKTF